MTYKDWYAIKSNQPTNQPTKSDLKILVSQWLANELWIVSSLNAHYSVLVPA